MVLVGSAPWHKLSIGSSHSGKEKKKRKIEDIINKLMCLMCIMGFMIKKKEKSLKKLHNGQSMQMHTSPVVPNEAV